MPKKQTKQPVYKDDRIGISVRLLKSDYNTLKELSMQDARSISRYVEKLIIDHFKSVACVETERG